MPWIAALFFLAAALVLAVARIASRPRRRVDAAYEAAMKWGGIYDDAT